MRDAQKFQNELIEFEKALKSAKRVLITAPGAADGDSIGAQLALRRMLRNKYSCEIYIINDEELPLRYQFLPDAEHSLTPEKYAATGKSSQFDLGIIVDGGIDRAGRVKAMYDQCPTKVFIDHHAVSCDYPYTIKMVEPDASATTELVYYISQTKGFEYPVDTAFAQHIYLGLIFDTGFFRHANTTPEVMELAAKLLRSDFDFTRVGERGMLERTYGSLKLLAATLEKAELKHRGKIIVSSLSQKMLREFEADEDDREGIVDHLFLTRGIQVAVLLFELKDGSTKISFRSQGCLDVAKIARSMTIRGGGHTKAAGALFEEPMQIVQEKVLIKLGEEIERLTQEAK